MPIPVLALLHVGSVPVWAQSITDTGIQLCQYRYWHFCILVQYQYGHSLLPALAFQNGARTGIGISAPWFSTSIGTFHYRNWHSKMVPVAVLALLHISSVPVWAQSVTGTSIIFCLYWYWHFCIQVQYRYRHNPLPVLAFKNGACTSTGISELWFSTSMGTFHYRNWHSKMVPVLVLEFLYFDLLSVLAWVITGTGIQWCPFRYWHFGTLVQYQYGHIPLLVLAFKNGARIGTGISAFWFSTSIVQSGQKKCR